MAAEDLAKVVGQKLPRSLSSSNTNKTADLEEFIKRVFSADTGTVKPLCGISKPTGFTVAIPPDVLKDHIRELSVILDVYVSRYLRDKRVINWTKDFEKLYVLQTRGDGNCLLHAASIGIWGVSDNSLTLRTMLNIYMTKNNEKLKDRWLFERKRIDKQLPGGVIYSDQALDKEWHHICRATRADTTVQMGEYFQYEHLEEIHVFALANVLQRPVIIYGESVVRNMQDSIVGENNFPGLYLPLLQNPEDCVQSPLLLAYHSSHFSPLVFHIEKATKTRVKIPLVDYKGNFLLVHCLSPDEEYSCISFVEKYLEYCGEYNTGVHTTPSYTWIQYRPIEMKYNLMCDYIKVYKHIRQEAIQTAAGPPTIPISPLRSNTTPEDEEMVLDLTENEPKTEEEKRLRKQSQLIWRSAPGKMENKDMLQQPPHIDPYCNGSSPFASTPPESKKRFPFSRDAHNNDDYLAASDFAIRLDKIPRGPPTEHYITPSIKPKYGMNSYPRDKHDLSDQVILSKLPTTSYNPRPKACAGIDCTRTGETSTLGYCIPCFLKGFRCNELTIPKIEEVRDYEETLIYENLTQTHGDWKVKADKEAHGLSLSKSYASFDVRQRGKCRNPCHNCDNTGHEYFNHLCYGCYETLTKPPANHVKTPDQIRNFNVNEEARINSTPQRKDVKLTSTPKHKDALVQGLLETGLISPENPPAKIILSPIPKKSDLSNTQCANLRTNLPTPASPPLGREERGQFLNDVRRPIGPPQSPVLSNVNAQIDRHSQSPSRVGPRDSGRYSEQPRIGNCNPDLKLQITPHSPLRAGSQDSGKYTASEYPTSAAQNVKPKTKCKNTLCSNFGNSPCDGYCNECFKRQTQIEKAEKNPSYVPMGLVADTKLQKCKNHIVSGCSYFGNPKKSGYCNECARSLYSAPEVIEQSDDEVYSFHSDHELEMMGRTGKY